MKTIPSPSLLLLGLTALAFTACGRAEQKLPVVTRSSAVPAPPAEAASALVATGPTTTEVMGRLKGHTYEQRAEFALLVQDLGRQSDAALAELNGSYIEVNSSPARRKAMEDYRTAVTDFKDKSSKVDNAQPENWDSITSNLATSWQNLQGAEARARAEKN